MNRRVTPVKGKQSPKRQGAKPAKAKVEAKRPVARKSRKRQSARVGHLEKRLAEALKREAQALEQQTATSEVLRAISGFPTDAQPVLDIIALNATRVCGARDGAVLLKDGTDLYPAAHHGPIDISVVGPQNRIPIGRDWVSGRALLDRRAIQVEDLLAAGDEYPRGLELARANGHRTTLATPLLREGEPMGVLLIRRGEVRLFTPKQMSLLEMFAAQAVIAIENVRLFNETKEALEQQTATSEILRVISSSPIDVQPVMDAVAESAARLCGAEDVLIQRIEGNGLRPAAHYGVLLNPDPRRSQFVMPVSAEFVAGRAVLERRSIHVHDMQDEAAQRSYPGSAGLQRDIGFRTLLVVPLLRKGTAIGTIVMRRLEMRPFSEKQIALVTTFADQAVIAIENVRLFTELQEKNRALTQAHAQVTETLDQQTATSEVLRVIAGSLTDLQPVLDTLVESAGRLCQAADTFLLLIEGDQLRVAALHGVVDEGARLSNAIHRGWVAGRAVVDARTVHVEDLANAEAEFPLGAAIAARFGHRTALAIPLLRKGVPIGALFLRRREVRQFSDKEIALLETFADQAVIAIENVRLFNEMEGRNRDLTATSEILRVISRSPTDVQPVLDAVVLSAEQLCETVDAAIFRVEEGGLRIAAHHGVIPPIAPVGTLIPVGRDSVNGRVVLEGRAVHVPDLQVAAEEFPAGSAHARRLGWRTTLAVPLMRENTVIGTIAVRRSEARPFSDKQIELLRTFADQAVIAVENVRLFKELEARNHDLTETLAQQTATSEILRVISHSPTDIQPVFNAIVRNAVGLCNGLFGIVVGYDGSVASLVAHHNVPEEGLTAMQGIFPGPPASNSVPGRAILSRAVVHVHDQTSDAELTPIVARAVGFRTNIAVPMLRDEQPIGVIAVSRREAHPFSEAEIQLLKTFADQAVIAVENVRLFKELEARTGELTQSVEQLTALGEVSRAVSSTLDVETVLDTIVSRASQLAGADGCAIYEYDDATEAFHIRATHNLDPVLVGTLRASPLRKGEGAMGRAAETREPTQVADIAAPGAYQSHIRDTLLGAGYRALLSVPLLREGEVIGSLSLNRHTPGEFPPEAVEVLKTFATQSALAIQNARLFREIADKSAQLEVASRHKSEFLANMSHELRTPLNAVIGFSEVLLQRMFGDLNDKQDEYLKDIYASGQHLLSLINDILDLSKIEAGRMELELTDFDLPTALDNTLTLIRERAGRRGIALHLSVDERLGQMRADERKIRQVVLNLLSNATKFTPEGGRIEVAAAPRDEFVEVSVSDTGIGIAPEDQEAVFEEFRQVGTAAKKVEGTGLGLALSRKFIELHGGRIWLQSRVDIGSTFTFTIPVRRRE
jgi:GAF domain-containing protein